MAIYKYTGDRTSIALPPATEKDEPVTIDLLHGDVYELPQSLPYVVRGVARGYLVPVEAPKSTRNSKGAE